MASDEKFRRPVQFVQEQERFKPNEVGLNHPKNAGYIRIRDNGDIELMANEGCGIIISAATQTIVLVADSIKFLTKETGGLRWNSFFFNEAADTFNEPALVPTNDHETYGLYKGVEQFLYDDTNEPDKIPENTELPAEIAAVIYQGQQRVMPQTPVTDPATGETITYAQYYSKYSKPPPFGTGSQ